jgi:hypothetical protein
MIYLTAGEESSDTEQSFATTVRSVDNFERTVLLDLPIKIPLISVIRIA